VHEAVWPLPSWEVFYLIVGASAAALIGLQFVVIVLGADLGALGGMTAVRAFATPTIVHFSAVLLISALVTAPWHGRVPFAISLGACGLTGVVYGIRIVRHARRQTDYAPDVEDWTWHVILPLVAYGMALVSAGLFPRYPEMILFTVGAVVLLLLFIGIHNAWDAVLYIARGRLRPEEPGQVPPSGTEA
jgi:hypothetical protein